MARSSHASSPGNVTLQARLIDGWLVFACPDCSQPVKVSREDFIHPIACPGCHHELESLLDAPPDFPENEAPAVLFLPARRLRASPLPEKRPNDPRKRLLRDLSRDEEKHDFVAQHTTEEARRLPVRSPEELEARQIEAIKKRTLHEEDPLANMEIVDDRDHSGKYKRVKVRTRRKRKTETQRAIRFYLLTLGASAAVAASVYGISAYLHGRQLEATDAAASGSSASQGDYIDDPKVAVARFLESDTVDSMLRFVRKPVVLADAMREYYQTHPVEDYLIRDVIMHRQDEAQLPPGFETGRVVFADRPAMTFYAQKTGDIGYRLDWPSFVGYGTLSWDQLRETHPRNPQRLRVLASPADYYAGPFSDANLYFCVRLEDIDRRHSVYGYARSDRVGNQDLRNLLLQLTSEEGRAEPLRLTLELQYPEGDCPDNQIEILQMVRDSWLIP